MNSEIGEKYTSELIRLFQQQSISLYNGHHSLCLTVPCLQYLQRQFLQLQETSGGPVPASLASYRQLQEHFSRIQSLKLITDRRSPPLLRTSNLTLNLEPFRALQALILKKIPLNLVIGLQRLRGQLHVLIIQRCDVAELDDVIVRCGGDNSTSLAWSSLRELDLSNNLIRKLGDSLQYLHCLEKVNFSNNQIGKRPRVQLSGDSSGTGSSVEGSINYGSVAVVRPNQEQSREAEVATEGIESIDSVQCLHLGFNKLRHIPKFGSRSKYNLRVLNLRNNELVCIDGLEELDNLAELDLTDNLLSKHSSLAPFLNLHHLVLLVLLGNPLCFHPKHRLKTAENLSNLIDKNSFKLDGKKLTTTEKKSISTSVTHIYSASHYSANSSLAIPSSNHTQTLLDVSVSQSVPVGRLDPIPPPVVGTVGSVGGAGGQGGLDFFAVPHSSQNGPVHSKKGRRKNVHTAKILDSDEEESSETKLRGEEWKSLDTITLATSNEEVRTSGSGTRLVGDEGKQEGHSKDSEEKGGAMGGVSDGGRGHNKERRGSRKRRKKSKKEAVADATAVPHLNEENLEKYKEMRLLMREKWLQVSLEKSASTTEEKSGSGDTPLERPHLSSPPKPQTTSIQQSEPLTVGGSGEGLSHLSAGGGSGRELGGVEEVGGEERVKREKSEDVVLSEFEGEYGPRTSSPDNREFSEEVEGDLFVVERYESDVEEERVSSLASSDARNHVMIRLCDGSLEEIDDTTGKVLDRWDLNCLMAASVEPKVWRSSEQKLLVLVLQFHLERRDRSRREYVLIEEGDGAKIMEILKPILEQNESTLSLGNKLECLQCQRVFDKAQALEQPSDSPEFLRSNTSYRARSISRLMCPHCRGYILQQSMPRKSAGRSGPVSPNGAAAVANPHTFLQTQGLKVQSGFDLDSSREDRSKEHSTESSTKRTPALENGYLEEFVDKQKSFSGGYSSQPERGISTSENSVTLNQPTLDERSKDGSYSETRSMNDAKKSVPKAHNSTSSSPDEAPYLEGYGTRRRLFNQDSTSNQERNSGVSVESKAEMVPPTKLSLEENLGPWTTKGKQPTASLNPFDGDDDDKDENVIPQPSVAVTGAKSIEDLQEVKDEFRNQGIFSDEERVGFGAVKTRESVEPETLQDLKLPVAPQPQQQRETFDEYSYNYGDHDAPPVQKLFHLKHKPDLPPDPYTTPNYEYSSSVPSSNFMPPHSITHYEEEDDYPDERPIKVMDGLNHHRRSNSTGFTHPGKMFAVDGSESPSSKRRNYNDPYGKGGSSPRLKTSNQSLDGRKESGGAFSSKKLSRNGSRSSLYSWDSDSSASARSDSDKRERRKSSSSSNEKLQGFSSGEFQRKRKSQQRNRSKSKDRQGGKDGGKSFGSKLYRVLSDVALNSPTKSTGASARGSNSSTSDKERHTRRRTSGGSSGRVSSGSGSAKSPGLNHSYHSSSDGTGRRKAHSPAIFYKDDDPTYIHNSINLYLDMEVFDSSKEECFKMAFRCPVVKYGEVGELPVLVIISNLHAFIFKIIAPESSRPAKWLKLGCQHSLRKLVYIDHGVAYQFLRVEFKSKGACYTFLMRDDKKCKLCSTELSLCVADAPGSSLRNVGVCPFNIDALQNPDRVRREAVMNFYESAPDRRSPTSFLGHSSGRPVASEDKLVLYRLAHRYHQDSGVRSPVTLVVTSSTLFLAKENFSHWPLPRLQDPVPKEALLPPFLDVEQRDITDVEKIILDRDQPKYIIVRFFLENSGYGESRQWRLLMHSSECVTKLENAIKGPWEASFETSFTIVYK